MSESMDPAAILKRVDETEKDVREQLKLGSHIKGVRPPSSVLINPEWLLFLCTILRTALADTRRVDWLQEKAVWFQGGEEWDAGINSEIIDIPLIEAGGNLRKACDAAMAATPRETNNE